ncbi:hypothetical protein T07_6386 [Trichinella nelsoni]|uniref:PiggyBac transposable element-derived protein domain-containing protein n=1 Tax=Trichinella nelsoni TaxID=6336 RepID=A0A0V0SGJ8_9BILA|nr:hypothetical protein T07_6386 [Trichinella nelsoni]
MGILSCGTTRPNRLRGCPLLSEKDLNSKGRGAYDFRTYAKKGSSHMNMGGIDLNNMLAALYRIEHKSRKWTRRIISTAVTDAWQLYKGDKKEMPGTYMHRHNGPTKSHSRASSPTPPLTSRRLGRRPTDVSREVAKDQTSH